MGLWRCAPIACPLIFPDRMLFVVCALVCTLGTICADVCMKLATDEPTHKDRNGVSSGRRSSVYALASLQCLGERLRRSHGGLGACAACLHKVAISTSGSVIVQAQPAISHHLARLLLQKSLVNE